MLSHHPPRLSFVTLRSHFSIGRLLSRVEETDFEGSAEGIRSREARLWNIAAEDLERVFLIVVQAVQSDRVVQHFASTSKVYTKIQIYILLRMRELRCTAELTFHLVVVSSVKLATIGLVSRKRCHFRMFCRWNHHLPLTISVRCNNHQAVVVRK